MKKPLKKWEDWATAQVTTNREPWANTLMAAVLRYRLLTVSPVTEAERDGVPFTPIWWWWWNHDADEYVMTLWDTEAGKDEFPAGYLMGTSDPAGTFGRPTKMIVPPSYRKAIRKLIDNK